MIRKLFGLTIRPRFLVLVINGRNYAIDGYPIIECDKLVSVHINEAENIITFKMKDKITEEWKLSDEDEDGTLWIEAVNMVLRYVMKNRIK